MESFDDDAEFDTGLCLNIDGDILIYPICCVHNELEGNLAKQKIGRSIHARVTEMMLEAGCSKFRMFLTGKHNFRDQLVDDYKANRKDIERPIYLAWAKGMCMEELGAEFVKGLEADDLLGIHQTDNTVLWSLDKDLRQVPGKHLNSATRRVVVVSEFGDLYMEGKKVRFNGGIGLFFQMLVGDTADYIVGCGKREQTKVKTGKNAGRMVFRRKGLGPVAGYNLLKDCKDLEEARVIVGCEYFKRFRSDWQEVLETQANLLFMVREVEGSKIRRWTYDSREEWFDLLKGEIDHEYPRERRAAPG
jgi:hypothetical protein